MGVSKLQVEETVSAAGVTVGAANIVGGPGVNRFGGHLFFLLQAFKALPIASDAMQIGESDK